MGRLTNKQLKTVCDYFISFESKEERRDYNKLAKNAPRYEEVYKKLADYEDLEEQGLLLRLPCKVGDTIYKLWYKPCHEGVDFPDSYQCCGCMDECDIERAIFEFKIPSQRWIVEHMDNFGDCVYFLTKKEAEEALKKMRENGDGYSDN